MTVELSFCCKSRLKGKRDVRQASGVELYGMTYLDQSADDAQRRKPQVLKRPRFRSRIEKRVQE